MKASRVGRIVPFPLGLRFLAVAMIAGAFLAGQAKAQFSGPGLTSPPAGQVIPTNDPAILNPAVQDLYINPGDVLAVRIFGQTDYAPPVRVSVDGNVELPLIGAVKVGGLTAARAQQVIADRLVSAGMFINPQVTVQVSETSGQFVTVSGELHAVIPVNGDRRLFEILAAAGSLPPSASHVITILRPGLDKPIVLNLGTDPSQSQQNNIRIQPRDTILISRVGVVYILGAFKVQGAIPLQQNSPLTLLQAAALSQGAGYEGRMDDLHIIRTNGAERTMVHVDLKKIMRGQAPDPILQQDDIVFLPTNAIKAAIKSGGIGTISGIASLLIIAFQNR